MPVWAPPLIGFRNWVGYTPTIPKFYWDVYSEEERIKKICMALHKIEEYLNYQTDTINKILEHYDDYEERITILENWRVDIDQHLDKVDASLESLAEEDAVLHELIDALDDNLAKYKEEVAAKFDDVQEKFEGEIDAERTWNVREHARINDAWKHANADLYTKLHNEIADISFDTLITLDPTTGELSPIAEVLANIYDTLRYFAITAGQFDALADLTAEKFDGKLMSAQQFDLYGYTMLTGGSIENPVYPVDEIDALTDDVAALRNKDTEIENSVTLLRQELQGTDEDVEEANQRIDDLSDDLAAIDSQVDKLFSNDGTLATGVGNAVQQTVSLTMYADNWVEGKYSFEELYPYDNGYTLMVSKDSSMTQDQMDAYDAAQMTGSSASNVLTTMGDAPTIDLPVCVLVVRHDVPDVEGGE